MPPISPPLHHWEKPKSPVGGKQYLKRHGQFLKTQMDTAQFYTANGVWGTDALKNEACWPIYSIRPAHTDTYTEKYLSQGMTISRF